LKEIAQEFGCSDVAISKVLKRLKISRKKTTIYKEADKNIRQKFVQTVENISPKNLVYIDECGIDQCLYREYARASIGEKI
jgi:hypothetical protein